MNAWNRFWFSRADVLPQAASRIALGVILLFFMLGTWPNWQRFYGADGIISLGSHSDIASRPSDNVWCVMAWTEGILPIEFWWWTGFVLTILFTVGYQTRWATIGLFIFQTSLIHRNSYVVNGEELVVRMLLFYGCFAPWGERLSMDSWLRARRLSTTVLANEEPILPLVWTWQLMQINFIAIYAISLPYKFAQDLDWLYGDAIHWTVASDMWWTRGSLSWITLEFNGLFRKLITWGTVLNEGLFPVLVCFQRTRVPSVLAIIAMHVGIALAIPGVTLFTLSMVAGALMFLPGNFYSRLYAFIRRGRDMLFADSRQPQAI